MLARLIGLTSIGTSLTSNPSLKRKILHCNISVLLAFWTLLFFLVIYTLTGDPLLRRVVHYEMPFLVLYLSPLLLNGLGQHRLASWTLMILLMISMAISIHSGVGTEFNIHLYFILFAVAPVSFFPRKQWRSAIFLCVTNTALYIYYINNPIASPPSFQPLAPFWKQLIITSVSTSVAFTTFFLFWLADSIAEKNEVDIENMAMTDALTKLPNRRAMEVVFKQEIAQSARSHTPLVFAMLDIDHFKRINDAYGHDVGDEALKYVARSLMGSTRSDNMIARIGGEEFGMLLPNTSLASALEAVERTRRLIEEGSYIHDGQAIRITISAGISLVDVHQSIDTAYKNSDTALYLAKNNGRNRVEIR